MAGRGHVDVNERRLKPIYDNLDNGNNKKAVQEADRLLKKQKDLLPAKALKALALIRLDKAEDALPILVELHNTNPTDEAVIQPLLACYKEQQQYEKIVNLYENACKAKPEDEDLTSGLFMAYVRVNDFKKQQDAARILNRLRPAKNPYYFWRVMSIVMQARANEATKPVLLQLAEKMTSKYVEENKIEADAEILLYVLILEHQNKYQLALDVLLGPFGERLGRNLLYREEKTVDLLVKLEKWPEVVRASKKLLEKEPDSWKHNTVYLDAVFRTLLLRNSPETTNGDLNDELSLENAVAFLRQQQEENAKFRGPLLAQLEFYRLAKLHNMPVTGLPEVNEIFIKYFHEFGDKSSWFGDIKAFINLLNAKDAEKIALDLVNELEVGETGSPKSSSEVKTLYRHICLLQFKRYLSLHTSLSIDEQRQLIEDLLVRYKLGLSFGEKAMKTELQPCDPYLLLASHHLYDLYTITGDTSYIFAACLSLENGLVKSPTSSHIKLLLLRLYALLGAHSQCGYLLESLEVKHMMYDSLGYLFTPELSRFGYFNLSNNVHDSVIKFFSSSTKEITENLLSAYKYGSFIKVEEMVDFKERLYNSVQFAYSAIEKMISDIIWNINKFDDVVKSVNSLSINWKEEAAKWDELRDNRDLGVVLSWDCVESSTTEDIKKVTFEEQKGWIRLRSLYLRAVCSIVSLSTNVSTLNSDSSEVVSDIENTRTLVKAITEHVNNVSQNKVLLETKFRLNYPPLSPLSFNLSSKTWSVLVDCFETALLVQQTHSMESAEKYKQIENLLKNKLPEFFIDLLSECKVYVGDMPQKFYTTIGKFLERASLFAETLGFVCIILGACHVMLKTRNPQLTKQGKKKAASVVVLPELYDWYRCAISSLNENSQQLKTSLQDVQLSLAASCALKIDIISTSWLQSDNNSTNKVTTHIDNIQKKLETSYQISLQNIESLLQTKIEFLSTLRL